MSSIALASPNIALIKYWGKIEPSTTEEINIGINPSLSMTLSQAQTRCEFSLTSSTTEIQINDSIASSRDQSKITEHVHRVARYFSKDVQQFKVLSSNNFPQGVGLASSASAYCALSLAIIAELLGKEKAKDYLIDTEKNKILSRLARLGSGSAARSTWGSYMYWDGPFAVPFQMSYKLYDTIVIVSKDHKKVSSREGHALALTSPYFPMRLQKLNDRIEKVKEALLTKKIHIWGPLIEEEALEMHEVAETSTPPVQYKSEKTLKILAALAKIPSRDYYFTMDAGPNIHFLSERPIVEDLKILLKEVQVEADIWEDWTGSGPVLVS